MPGYLLAEGQEPTIRRLLTPPLPSGWTFEGAQIERASVRARYSCRGALAELQVEHRNARAPEKGSVATETLCVRLRASAGAPAATLFKTVLASLASNEQELRWIADATSVFRELAERGRVREALAFAEQAPGEPALALASARLRASFHDYAAATRDARIALTGRVNDRLAAATVLARTGHRDEAIAIARSIARQPGTSAPVLEDLGALLRSAGDHEGAVVVYERAAQTSPGAHVALGTYCAWRGDSAGARRHAQAAIDFAPADALAVLGIADALDGAHRDAFARFDAAIALRPSDSVFGLWRAESLMHLGDLERARDEAQRARDLTADGTNHVPALLLRAAVLTRLGVREPIDPVLAAAMQVLSAADPTDWTCALRAIGGNRTEQTTYLDERGALRHLALDLAPRSAAKQALWRFAATADVDEAERDFARVRARYPDVVEINNYHGELFLYLGDAARARKHFERAIAEYERSRWAYIGLAAVALLEDRPADALTTLARGIELGGGTGPTAYVYRGEAHRRLGHLDEARADLEYAVQLNPSRVGAWVNLALVYAERHDDAELARTMAVLRTRAPAFVADAAEALGDCSDTELLEEMLSMLRGNRASTGVTYFTRGGTLRTVPPHVEAR